MTEEIRHTSSEANRRQNRRISLSAHAILTLLVPELTNTPKGIRCVAKDLSMGGVKIKTYQIGEDVAGVLAEGIHWAKIQMELPYIDHMVELTSRVVWSQFMNEYKKKEVYTLLGLAFDKVPAKTKAEIEYVVSRLSGDSVDAVSIRGVKLEKRK